MSPTDGSTNRLRNKPGPRVVTLRSLTAPRRPRYSMRTGYIPLETNFLLHAPIAVDYLLDPRLPAQLMRRGPTASCFRSARRTAIDEQIAPAATPVLFTDYCFKLPTASGQRESRRLACARRCTQRRE